MLHHFQEHEPNPPQKYQFIFQNNNSNYLFHVDILIHKTEQQHQEITSVWQLLYLTF